MRLNALALLPLACSLAAFVLAMLVLFAGSKPNFMESYHIISLNTSMLGHELISTLSDTASSDDNGGGVTGWFADKWDELSDAAKDKLDAAAGDVADKLAAELGISQWYSLHLTAGCEGSYLPNATAPAAGLNVTNCTARAAGFHLNLTGLLDRELRLGPLRLTLDDLDFPRDEVDERVGQVNRLTTAVFALFAAGAGLAGLSMLAAAAAAALLPPLAAGKAAALANLALAALAAVVLAVAAIATTVGARVGADKINEVGGDVGLSASAGGRFMALAWAAFALMAVAALCWVFDLCLSRRKRRIEYTEKRKKRFSHGSA